jgi:two-component system sensor histidine kinase/response regulator
MKKDIDISSLLAHSVKSPMQYLTYVSNYLVGHWAELDEDEKRESVEIIQQSASDIVDLLEQVINWNKLNDGQISLNPAQFSLSDLMEDELALHRAILKVKNIDVHLNIPKSIVMHSDPVVLKMIVHNILTNAIKYSEKNSVIKIDYHKKNNRVFLTITDQGKGMGGDELSAMLAEEATTTYGTSGEWGTGIGVQLTQALVNKLKGELRVQSQLNVGTSVSIVFPDKP